MLPRYYGSLHAEQRGMVVVEEVAGARLVVGDSATGQVGWMVTRNLDDVGARILAVAAGAAPAGEARAAVTDR